MKGGRSVTHRGFTLIELLIVIVVIGILSTMMMFSSTEAADSAKATKIVSDLKMLQRAVLAWYLDNYDRFIWATDGTKNGYKLDGNQEIHTYLNSHPKEIQRYFSSNFKLSDGILHSGGNKKYDSFYATLGGFSVYMGEGNTVCYVVYKISDDDKKKDQNRLRDKLMGRAKSAGLLSYDYNRAKGKKAQSYDRGNYVFMEVFRFDDDEKRRK